MTFNACISRCVHTKQWKFKKKKNLNKRKELLQSCRPRRRHLLSRLYTEQRTAINNGLNESSVFTRDTSGKVAKRDRKRDTTQCNTAKLKQPRPNIAAPMSRYTARQIVVNTYSDRGRYIHHSFELSLNLDRTSARQSTKQLVISHGIHTDVDTPVLIGAKQCQFLRQQPVPSTAETKKAGE